jgi:acid phosphatase type 7
MRRIRLSIYVLALLTILTGGATEIRPTLAQSVVPAMTMTADGGLPGDSIFAVRSGFSYNANGTLIWLPSSDFISKLRSRSEESLRKRSPTPDVPAGDYIVLAKVGSQTAQATFHVGTLSPATETLPLTKTATKDQSNTTTLGSSSAATATPAQGSGSDAVLLAAGDIASCSGSGDEATAKLLDGLQGTVATLGDNVYDKGTAAEFAKCYDPSWGRHKARTKPAPGNHDYNTPGAAGYYGYFGAAAGDPTKGYYSYDLGAWHVIVLNSNISMASGSAQEQWLISDLKAHPADCTLAYWHHPRYSSGSTHGSDPMSQAIWQDLYDARAEIVLVGHEHNYERFAPMDASGAMDKAKGIREFVVGTGGRSHYPFGRILATSEVHNSDTFGVLQLTLHPSSYDWKFIPVAGMSFTDSGSGTCH